MHKLNEGLNPFTPTLSHEHVHKELNKVTSEHGMSGVINVRGIDLEGGPLRKSDYIHVKYTPRAKDETADAWFRKKNRLTITHHEKNLSGKPGVINKFEYEVKDKKHLGKILGDFHNYLSTEKINTDAYHAEAQAAHEKAEKKKQERKARIAALITAEPKKKRKPRKTKKVVNNDEQN